MNNTDQRIEQLASCARRASLPAEEEMPFGFATRVLASLPEQAATGGDLQLWTRLSLASLPFAAIAAAGCLYWISGELSADAGDLAQQFVQTPLLP